MRNILAIIAGLIITIITITLIEKLGHLIFPYPEGVKPGDMEWLKNNTDLIPLGAMISVIIAHVFGIIFGMGITGFISKESMIPAYIVGITMLVITFIMFFLIPSPIWYLLSDGFGVIAGFFFGKTLAQKRIFN